MTAARTLLRRFYGYDSFRAAQEPVIESLLSRQDTVAIMPTGAGKSICFQIPALMLPGITLVISPLISLMKDQVDALTEQGVPATFLNSTLSFAEAQERLKYIASGECKLVYLAPERLESENFRRKMAAFNVSMVAVDEAHCVSQWGHDFRPSYRLIAPFIAGLPRRPLMGAFTATATPEVKDDMVKLLKLREPRVYVSGFDRPNLSFAVLREKNKDAFVASFVQEHVSDAGIIYTATRKNAESLCDFLRQRNIRAGCYHAGLTDEERKEAQEDFLYDNISVIVATCAFGMGIDKSNVRYVIHYNMPQNVEAYYQEAGRAGRDGENAQCLLLFSESDVATQRYLINRSGEDEARIAYNLSRLQFMVNYCHTTECLRHFIINYFGDTAFPRECHNCSNCLSAKSKVDVTIDAQKVFSCVYRLNRAKINASVVMVTRVLMGSKDKRLLALGLDKLSTYGLFRSRERGEIKELVQRFMAADYLEQREGQYANVVLKSSAYPVLKSEAKVYLNLPQKAPSRARTPVKEPLTVDTELFEALRVLRKKIARQEKVPPYMVFADSALRDMCAKKPRTLEAMRQVKGVGDLKLQRYGQDFLACLMANSH
ncbi:MAG: DNA helicase RecQ [Selenomonadaceae bacterium]|nr:DNA helicase RecQ [Selenomonadaceae bacterium]